MKTIGIIYFDDDGIYEDRAFSNNSSVQAYTTFSRIAKKKGFHVLAAKPEWYKDGSFTQCWDLLSQQFLKDQKIDFCWDRYCMAPSKEDFDRMQNLRADIQKQILLMNDPFIEKIATDKYFTWEILQNQVPKTFLSEDLQKAKSLFKGKVVTKPRYGAHGIGVQIQDIENITTLPKNYIIQPFIDSSRGISGVVDGVHDIRVMLVNGDIVDSFVRIPKEGLLTNISQGGSLKRIPTLPNDVVKKCVVVDKKMEKYIPRFYSIDFMFDGKRAWVIELNAHPGLRTYFSQQVSSDIYETLCTKILDAIEMSLK